MSWTRVCPLEELPVGALRRHVGEEGPVLACRVADDEVRAVEDLCTHDDGPLAQGWLDGDVLECPRHGARFDVRTGEVRRLPAAAPLRTFRARIRDGWVEVAAGGDAVAGDAGAGDDRGGGATAGGSS